MFTCAKELKHKHKRKHHGSTDKNNDHNDLVPLLSLCCSLIAHVILLMILQLFIGTYFMRIHSQISC